MKTVARILKRGRLSKGLVYVLTWCMLLNTSLPLALALEGANLAGATGVIDTTWGDHTIIDTDHGAIINWNNFDTSSGQSVTFNQYMGGQLSGASAVLNRVSSGAVPTQFNGALNANGRVFLVNPAGIIFGAGSTVNISQLVASGLNMSDAAFKAVLADSDNQMAFEGGEGQVRNLGAISAESVYLVGSKVTNVGSVKAPNGLVVMAAGDSVYLAQDGSSIVVELAAGSGGPGADVENRSLVSADNGKIVLAAGDSFSGAVSNAGVLAASAGEVVLAAASVENAGRITVDAAQSDAGSINMTATEEIVLQPGSLTTANARTTGDGGDIVLASEGTVVVSEGALVEAKGGSKTGDGGLVEISGEHFVLAGDVDASAANGEAGTLLIDPADVTVADGPNLGAPDTVYEQDIESDSQAGMNVLVEAEKSITVEDIRDDEITGGAGDIRLRATGADSSVVFVDRDDRIAATVGDLVIEAGGGGISIGNLVTGEGLSGQRVAPGRITVTTINGGDIIARNLYINSGSGHAEVSVDSAGNLTIDGDVSVGKPGEGILDVPNGSQAEAIIHLVAGGNAILDGDVVGAYADGRADAAGSTTWAYITVRGGANGTAGRDVTIKADLIAQALSSDKGRSRAYVDVDSTDHIYFGPDAAAPVADTGHTLAEGYKGDRDTDAVHIAKVLINGCKVAPAPQPDPDPEPEPGPEPEPAPQPEPEPEPEPQPQPEPEPQPEPQPQPEPEPQTAGAQLAMALSIPPAPIPDEEIGTSGCSALMRWAAAELGVDEKMMNIWMANSVASSNEIQPCDTCARLRRASSILRDYPGTRIAALTEVINEFSSSDVPLSEEQDASITAAIANSAEGDDRYAVAAAYLDSLAEYVAILNSEMNFSRVDSVTLAADRYVAPLISTENAALVGFLSARLTALGES